jgi:hypothetical protein
MEPVPIPQIACLDEIPIGPAMPRPENQTKTKAISIRQREVRLILAQGPDRATDLPKADQDSNRPMAAPAAPALTDLPEDRHPKWTEAPDPEAHPAVQKKDPVPAVRPSARCSDTKSRA